MTRLLEEGSRTLQSQNPSSSEAQAEAVLAQMQAFAVSESRVLLLSHLSQQSAQQTDDDKDVWLHPFAPMPVTSLLPKARVFSPPLPCLSDRDLHCLSCMGNLVHVLFHCSYIDLESAMWPITRPCKLFLCQALRQSLNKTPLHTFQTRVYYVICLLGSFI